MAGPWLSMLPPATCKLMFASVVKSSAQAASQLPAHIPVRRGGSMPEEQANMYRPESYIRSSRARLIVDLLAAWCAVIWLVLSERSSGEIPKERVDPAKTSRCLG